MFPDTPETKGVIPKLRQAICRCPSPSSYRSRSTSLSFRMEYVPRHILHGMCPVELCARQPGTGALSVLSATNRPHNKSESMTAFIGINTRQAWLRSKILDYPRVNICNFVVDSQIPPVWRRQTVGPCVSPLRPQDVRAAFQVDVEENCAFYGNA